MKLWKKIALGVSVLVILAANQKVPPSFLSTVPPSTATRQIHEAVVDDNDVSISENNSSTLKQHVYSEETPETTPSSPELQKSVQPAAPSAGIQKSIEPQKTAPLSNFETKEPATSGNTYINSAGNQVQSPTFTESQPQGATARCRDGSYSFSQSRRGTCSGHKGVAEWL